MHVNHNSNKSGNMYSSEVHINFKCVLYYYAHLNGSDVYLLQMQIYCYKINHTAENHKLYFLVQKVLGYLQADYLIFRLTTVLLDMPVT
jgi:hypothetical protein